MNLVEQLDLVDRRTGRLYRVAWRPAEGIFEGDMEAAEYCREACAFARQHGSVSVDPIPTSIATPAPDRDPGQLGAVLESRFVLPELLAMALDALREQDASAYDPDAIY